MTELILVLRNGRWRSRGFTFTENWVEDCYLLDETFGENNWKVRGE